MKKHAVLLASLLALFLVAVLPAAMAETLFLPEDLTSIGDQAFYGTSAETIVLPEGVTAIGDAAFGGSASLREVYVPDALMDREEAALPGSPDARFVSLSRDWSDLYDYTVSEGSVAVDKYKGSDTAVMIPPVIDGNPVTVIGQNAFKGKTNLTSVTVPEGVVSIGAGAFADCTGLTQISLPSSLSEIGGSAFAYCGSSVSGVFYLSLPDNLTSIQQTGSSSDSFYNCNAVKLVTPGSATAFLLSSPAYTMGDNSYNKQWFTFRGCEDFRYLYFRDQVNGAETWRLHLIKYMGSDTEVSILPRGGESFTLSVLHRNAFKDRTAVTKVIIPEGVEVLEASVFQGCTSLSEISFPSSLREIRDNAFTDCGRNANGVFFFDLPDNLTYIQQNGSTSDAFYSCNAVRRVTPDSATALLLSENLPATESWWNERWFTFAGQEDFMYLYFTDPVDGVETRRLHLVRYTGTDAEISVPAQKNGHTPLSTFHANLFKGRTAVTKVIIPEGVEVLEASVFQGCTGLSEISFPSSLREIHDKAFYECGKSVNGIFYFDLPDNLTYIKQDGSTSDAFEQCKAVRRVTVNSATAHLLSEDLHNSEGWWANRWFTFSGEEDFRYLYFSGETGGDAHGCGLRLVKYTGHDAIVSVPTQAADVPPLTSIHTEVFLNNTTLTNLDLPDTITLIKARALQGCVNLSMIHIPTSLAKLEENVFTRCAENAITGLGEYPTYEFPMEQRKLEFIADGSNLATFYDCKAVISFPEDPNPWQ